MIRVKPQFLITNYLNDGSIAFYDVFPCNNAQKIPRGIGSNESIVIIHPLDYLPQGEVHETVAFMNGRRYYLKRK